jgi:hypothetical protein
MQIMTKPTHTRRAVIGMALVLPLMPRLVMGQLHASEERALMQIRVTFGPEDFAVTLFDNPSSREFAELLPLDLTIEDFSGNEKIARMPNKLTNLVRGPVPDAGPGDLCIYVPWGNLAFFHGRYESTRDLVRLGRLDGEVTPLLTRGEFPVHIERL